MKLVPATSVSDLATVQAMYEDGFDSRLRVPFADLLTDKAFVLFDGEPRGLAVLRELGDTGWVFLRYFVVGERGRGLGEIMWKQLCDAMTGYTRIIFDVEDPAEGGIDAAEETIRHRRIAFYTRLGAVLLPVRGYRTPHGDGDHPMLLMAATLGDDLQEVVTAVYRYRYGLDVEHPLVAQTLQLTRPPAR